MYFLTKQQFAGIRSALAPLIGKKADSLRFVDADNAAAVTGAIHHAAPQDNARSMSRLVSVTTPSGLCLAGFLWMLRTGSGYSMSKDLHLILAQKVVPPAQFRMEPELENNPPILSLIEYSDASNDCQKFSYLFLGAGVVDSSILKNPDFPYVVLNRPAVLKSMTPDRKDLLDGQVGNMKLSGWCVNAFQKAGIQFVGELVQKTDFELSRIPGFGKKSLKAVKEKLAKMGLALNMTIPDWKPPVTDK